MSHPSRGAWIEIRRALQYGVTPTSRTPHGVRGLKLRHYRQADAINRRTPHGVRGLKYDGEAQRGAHARRTPHGVRGLK